MNKPPYIDDVSSDSVRVSLSPTPKERELFFCAKSVGFLATRHPYRFNHTIADRDAYMIIFTVSGTGILNYDDIDYLLDVYSVAFIPGNAKFTFSASPGDQRWRFLYLMFSGKQAKRYYNYIMDGKKPVASIGNYEHFISLIWQIINRNKSTMRETSSGFSTSINIQELLSEIYKIDAPMHYETLPSPTYIKKIYYYIDSRYTEKITLDILAKRFSMSKFYISRQFKEYSGVTVNEYIIQKRIERAKFLLKHTNKSVSDIADEIGFHSSCHLINHFKTREFITPNVYRKIVKK